MFGLQVAAPVYFIIEFVVVLFQNLDRLGIGHMSEIGVQYMIQSFQKSLIHKAVEEVHLFRSMLQHIADNVFEHGLCQYHVVL